MIRHTTKIPWWFPDGKALAYLMGGACLAVALLTVSRFIQGFPYAVVVLGASFGAAVYWLVRLLKRHSNVLLSEASADFLQEWGAYLVAWAILLPLAVSWLENETFRAAWSPVDYWRDEAREAAEQNCDVEREWMNRSAEEVQIAIRKRSESPRVF